MTDEKPFANMYRGWSESAEKSRDNKNITSLIILI